MTTTARAITEVVAGHRYQRYWLLFEIMQARVREELAGTGKSKERKRLQKELVRLRAARKSGQPFISVE